MLEGLCAADVAAIDCFVPPLVLRLVGRPWTEVMTPAYARLCLPFLAAQMLVRGRIDPHHFGPAAFGDAELRAIGARVSLHDDGNPDANALSPQRFVVRMTNGDTIERTVAATPGSPADPLSPAAHADRLEFARSMARVPPSDKPPLRLLTGRL